MANLTWDKAKKRWKIDYRDPKGKRRRTFVKDKANAKDIFKAVDEREEKIKHKLTWIEDIPYVQAIQHYRRRRLDNHSCSHSIKTFNRLAHLSSYLPVVVSAITEKDIAGLLRKRMESDKSNKTINEDRIALNGFFKWAVKENYISFNPCSDLEALPKMPRKPRRAFTTKEVESLLSNSCACCYPIMVILANTGIRMGELYNLNKEDFDLERKALFIKYTEQTMVKGRKSRVIPLCDALIPIVRSLPGGKIMHLPRPTFRDHFVRIRKLAGIPDASPHYFRHTFTSHLVENPNIPLAKAMRITGHEDLKTMQGYMHSIGTDLQEFRNTVQFSVPSGCHNPAWTSRKREHLTILEPVQDENKPVIESQVTEVTEELYKEPNRAGDGARTRDG